MSWPKDAKRIVAASSKAITGNHDSLAGLANALAGRTFMKFLGNDMRSVFLVYELRMTATISTPFLNIDSSSFVPRSLASQFMSI